MQVIVFPNDNGGVAMCIPTGEIPINEVLVKDCPETAIIVDYSDLPQDQTYFNAWELVNGKVIVNETKKQTIINEKEKQETAKQTALNKLINLGLTEEEALALGVK